MARAASVLRTAIPNLESERLGRWLFNVSGLVAVLRILWAVALTSGLLGDPPPSLANTIAELATLAMRLLMAVGALSAIGLFLWRLSGREAELDLTQWLLNVFGVFIFWLLSERVTTVVFDKHYPVAIWGLQLTNGLVLGSMYSLLALGYTLVYGILFMINFAHGEVLMFGAYAGYFSLQFFIIKGFLEFDALGTILALLIITSVGMVTSLLVAIAVERVAYRPLRKAPRLTPLISAIGASIFLQQVALRIFGPSPKAFQSPDLIDGVFLLQLGELGNVPISKTGVLLFVVSIAMMAGLYLIVQRTKVGRAMRAVAEDKETASLMGVNVDGVIAITFALGAALAGAAGVMWGFHNKLISPFVGFIPGLKAFTAAVLGGIGNVPGAMFGGIFLGVVEAFGPFALGFPTEYKDVIAFSLLVLVLVFRPSGLLGEVLTEKKV
jgi:branched-chain amino acid transport system permease protein